MLKVIKSRKPRSRMWVSLDLSVHRDLKDLWLSIGGTEASWKRREQALLEELKTAPHTEGWP